jgi:diacylglycerol kinase family enzyme
VTCYRSLINQTYKVIDDVLQVSHHVVLNASAGTAASSGIDAQQLVARFAKLGLTVSVDADRHRPFEERLQSARNSTAAVLVAAGGDGTATALASVAIETGRPLALIPLGTANLLARDLRLPLTMDEWFANYPSMVRRRIDVGEVNGTTFVHKVVIGAVPGIAAAREQIRGRSDLQAKLGFLAHFVRRLGRLRRFAAEVTPGKGEPHIERVQSIAVANNDYDEGPGKVFSRSRLDGGMLSLYLLRQLTLADALRLGVGMLAGSWRNDGMLEIDNVRSVTIRTRGEKVRAMVDGEVLLLDAPLSFRIKPLALSIIAPPDDGDAATAEAK